MESVTLTGELAAAVAAALAEIEAARSPAVPPARVTECAALLGWLPDPAEPWLRCAVPMHG